MSRYRWRTNAKDVYGGLILTVTAVTTLWLILAIH